MNWLKDKKLKMLIYACVLSLAALIILFGLRMYAPTLLDIDVKWLIVAALPILLALVIGGFIAKFKGGGIEIEIAAEGKIIDHEEVFQIIHPLAAQTKADLDALYAMSPEQKRWPNVLSFMLGKTGYYAEGAIKEYVKELKNVQFFMFLDQAGKFVGMLHIRRSLFKREGFQEVYEFISEIEQGRIPTKFGVLINNRISADTRIVDAYKRLKSKSSVLIVFAEDNKELPIGYITIGMVEHYLADLFVHLADKERTRI